MPTIRTKVGQCSIDRVLLQLMCIDAPTLTPDCGDAGDGSGEQQSEGPIQEDNDNDMYADITHAGEREQDLDDDAEGGPGSAATPSPTGTSVRQVLSMHALR